MELVGISDAGGDLLHRRLGLQAPPSRIPARATVKLSLRFTAPQQPQHNAKQVVTFTANAKVLVIELTIRARVGLPLAAQLKVAGLQPAGKASRLTGW